MKQYRPPKQYDSPGFFLQKIPIFDKDLERVATIELVLPISLSEDDSFLHHKSELANTQCQAFEQAQAKRFQLERESEAAKATKDEAPVIRSPTAASTPHHSGSLEPALDSEREALSRRHDLDTEQSPLCEVAVYIWDEPLKLLEDLKIRTPDRALRERGRNIFDILKGKGNFRSSGLQGSRLELFEQALELLRRSQPHFGSVLDLVQEQLALAAAKKQPLRLPPMLLLGAPGVGKTHFSHELARLLDTPIRRHSFDFGTTEATLMGGDKRWGNTATGLVFDMICLGDRADPVVLLDEIDKAMCGSYTNPLAPLHSLLEPLTATRVRDISVDFEFDASHITWIATANQAERVPEPIRSRFVEFVIEQPTGAHALEMTSAIAMVVYHGMNLDGFDPPGPMLVKLLAHLSAREQTKAWQRAYGKALANGRQRLLRLDLPAEVLADDGDDSGGSSTGYLH